ncbi:MAG: type VI secretion system baseplate subunit TssE [Deltaproteobacteria bacterium]|nr:type VI secretion system baseplate subunit TssE [Deltaproteobacteria bacterium]MBW2597080.1 type VI secretion system baseplate subunit TssE [Deltaproteobacteria bacterium]MBW2638718.1 type VI secretion system baseplate subunit TssE [Deltaproteobacteria bacterium]MBW2679238.1 type VI secretion system baseplate subunit TssE [Deltaproteobacteria bacterium]
MREDRLLKRISAWKKEPHTRLREDPKRTIDSVLDHLQQILNTRQGSVPIGEDYGVPDFTELLHAYPDSVRDFERSIQQTIQKYEPRLNGIRVRLIPQDEDLLSLRFQITAKLATEDHKEPVLFESVVDSDGKISITG